MPAVRLPLIYTAAVVLLLCTSGCAGARSEAPTAAEVDLLMVETSNPGAVGYAEDDCDAASEAWAIDIARKAVEEREDRSDWPHGAEYRLIRRSAVQSWVIARRVSGYDAEGRPRYSELWDRGIIIDELGKVMFYVPVR